MSRQSRLPAKADAAVVMARAQAEAARLQLGVLQAQATQAIARQQVPLRRWGACKEQSVVHGDPCPVRRHRRSEGGWSSANLVASEPGHRRQLPLREKLYVVANFKETQLRHMEPGMRVPYIPI